MAARASSTVFACFAALSLGACGEDAPPCRTSLECGAGLRCVDGRCEPSPDGAPSERDGGAGGCSDGDGDGFGVGVCRGPDCDDADPMRHPGAAERCDRVDDDCDGRVDEDVPALVCGMGACERSAPGCADGTPGVCEPGAIAPETCNGVDDDCDGSVDEGFADSFDAPELSSEWVNGAVGGAISYSIGSSLFRIDDAPFAPTPSMPGTSWIYEPDVDLGNQMQVARDVGAGDFHLRFAFEWASEPVELTLGGMGFVSAGGQLELMLGYTDGSSLGSGAPFARLRAPGDDLFFSGPELRSGAARFEVRREAGVVTVLFGGAEVLTGALGAEITHLAIFAVAHQNSAGTYPFGSLGVDEIELCY